MTKKGCNLCDGANPAEILSWPGSHRPIDRQEGVKWTILEDGDGQEQVAWKVFLCDIPTYELFWRCHIAPQSFRKWRRRNKFIRPFLAAERVALADASYATFFHLNGMHLWRRLLASDERDSRFTDTQALYCYFSHAFSLQEAMLSLAKRVNIILRMKPYGAAPAFRFEKVAVAKRDADGKETDGTRPSWRLAGCSCGRWPLKAHASFFKVVNGYRNLLVHRKPLFVWRNLGLPRLEHPGSECLTSQHYRDAVETGATFPHLEALSGLTGISRARWSKQREEQCYLPLGDLVDSVSQDGCDAAGELFALADYRLDGLGDPYWASQDVLDTRDQMALESRA